MTEAHRETGPAPIMLGRAVDVALSSGALATLGFMLYAGEPAEPVWWLSAIVFGAWALAPYLFVAWETRRQPPVMGSRVLLALAAVVMTAFGVAVLVSAFVLHPDPQSGLVILFVPIWQSLGLVPFVLGSRYFAFRSERRSDA